MMDSEIEKYVKMENQLQERITELFAENKILESKISVLNECLSLKKVKQKISDLEHKQKILKNLEGVVNKLKNDIKPLEYLKQVLQKQLKVSSLSSYDYNFKELKNSDSEHLSLSRCAIETLDSFSDVSSEESIVIIPEDEVSDCDEFNSTLVSEGRTFDEALLRASVVHSLKLESLVTNNETTESSSNKQLISRDYITLMNSSDTSEQFLKMFEVVNEEDLLHDSKHDKRTVFDTGKIESTTPEFHKLHIVKETLENAALDNENFNNPPSTLLSSWVQVNEFKSIKTSLKNKVQKCEDLFQAIIGLQKDKIIQDVNTAEVSDCVSTNQLYFLQPESKTSNIKSVESDYNNVDHNEKNMIYNPVFSTNIPKYELLIKSSMLNSEDSSSLEECGKSKVNTEICEKPEKRIHNKIDQLCSQCELKEFNDDNNTKNVWSYIDKIHNNKIEAHNLVDFSNVQKNKIPIKSPLFNTDIKSSKLLGVVNNLSGNINIEQSTIIDKTSIQPCSIHELNNSSLNVNLLNIIHQHGFHTLTSLQLLFLSHCLSGQDIIFYSYPCVGKSTICLISVLQRINTSINECQAVVLVPTLVAAMSVQKMIESLGKFLNVSSCVGCANNFHEVSSLPHVVVSTLNGLRDMVNLKLLCKDFIKMLVIDDADEMMKCYEFSNQIRNVLLFLNKGCQLIVVSSSKLEEVFDHFSDVMKNTRHIIMYDEKPFLESVSQYYVDVSEDWKFDDVCKLYESLNLERAVVYCNSWNKCLKIANKCLKTFVVLPVHNSMAFEQRQKILEQFRSGTRKLLITTELLKGEDFSDITWVINYDFPKYPEEYVRKIVGFFRHKVNVINIITLHDTMAKEHIETVFKVQMIFLPQVVTDLCVPDIDPNKDLILNN